MKKYGSYCSVKKLTEQPNHFNKSGTY